MSDLFSCSDALCAIFLSPENRDPLIMPMLEQEHSNDDINRINRYTTIFINYLLKFVFYKNTEDYPSQQIIYI